MIRVVVTGSECTGKSTLVLQLADQLGIIPTEEFLRNFVADRGALPSLEDLDEVVLGQVGFEDAAVAGCREIVLQDTDLLSTVVYSRHYFGTCPSAIIDRLSARLPDLYLLCDIDVPWVPDGLQRDRGDRREEMQGLFESTLKEFGASVANLRGNEAVRLKTAIATIRPFLAESYLGNEPS